MLDLSTRKPLNDKIEWVKVSSADWRGNGFYYSRYPQPEKGRELSSANEDHQVYYHRIGTPQSQDELVYKDPKNPQRFHTVSTTEDERFLILDISDRGTGKQGNAIMVMDLSKPGREVHAADSRHHRRQLQRAGEHPRRIAGLHRQQRAQWSRRPHQSGQPGAGELDGHHRAEDRADRRRRHRRRQDLRDLHEGRRVEGIRPQPRRHARERDRAARPRGRERLRRQHGRQVRVLQLHLVHLSVDDLPLRHLVAAQQRCSARRRFLVSTPTSTRPSRSSCRARTAPRCRCSSPTEGAQARRQQPDADVRLRRVQHRDHPRVQLAARRAARAGLRLRQRQHARRQRVRRGMARRRARRRRNRTSSTTSSPRPNGSSPTSTRHRRGWRRRADPTAGCWSAP